ncbi:MAG: hypothetical protein J1F61_05755 [Clostridiales bacterium]|nr:hypothetical protein [Clostridiales bacterium]
MKKLHKKLLVFLSVLVCSLCLVFGLAACNNTNGDNTNKPDDDEHTHTFGGVWLYDGAEGHYRLATCHPDEKSDLEPHVDGNENGKCDVCDYPMAAEEDEHKHDFEEKWTFNEKKHWHNAICEEHFTDRDGYADHSFKEGVCECGVKESEVKVYDLYRNSPEYDLEFVDWLEWLADNNVVEVEYTESGDGVYHYQDGTEEVRFLGERTVKVMAQSDGDPVANVWFMVAMYNSEEQGYYESKGTIALGIAKTDATGVAEITFRPVGGYSSATIKYRIRLAERKDIAVFEGVTEENASLPFPNRYEVKGGAKGFEFEPYEVSENVNSDDIAATIEFNYSKGWNTYNKIYLPYRRYYGDLINGENLKEEGTTYNFKSSGEDLFDYFYFSPAKYSFAGVDSVEDKAKIEENAKIASSGVYKISFTVDRNANAELFFWDEQGVMFDAAHNTNLDGTPSNMYITARSGGTAGSGKYTGGDYVEVKIRPSTGLRLYQLGIKTDIECNVTITVERTANLGVGTAATFVWDEDSQKSEIRVPFYADEIVQTEMEGVTAGAYTLTFKNWGTDDKSTRFYAWTDTDERKVCIYSPSGGSVDDVYISSELKGVITIAEDTKYIYLQDMLYATGGITITLEKYTTDTPVTLNQPAHIPVTPQTSDISYTLPLSVPAGTYELVVKFYNKVNLHSTNILPVYIGGTKHELTDPSFNSNKTSFTYTETIDIGESDNTISIRCLTEYYFTASVHIKEIVEEPEPEFEEIEVGTFTISAGATQKIFDYGEIKISGGYLVYVETDTEAKIGVLTLNSEIKSADYSCDMYMPVSNKFGAYFNADLSDKLSISNISDAEITITVKMITYEAPAIIEADKEYDIPSNHKQAGDIPINIDPSLTGKTVKITILNWAFVGSFQLHPLIVDGSNGSTKLFNFTADNVVEDGAYAMTVTIPEGKTSLIFRNNNPGGMRNIVVKIEIVES